MAVSRTATARPFGPEDFERLVAGERITAYEERFHGLYEQVDLLPKISGYGHRDPNFDIYEVVIEDGDVKQSMGRVLTARDKAPVGRGTRVEKHYERGAESQGDVFSSDDAAFQYYLAGNLGDASKAMEAMERATERYMVADPDGEEIDLMPLFGSKVTLTMYVEDDLDHEALREKTEALLRKEFVGCAIPKILSKTVVNERVNVSTLDGQTLAVDVLSDTVGVYTRGMSVYSTTYNDPRVPLRGKDQI